MANHASAIKRIRSNETKRVRNRYQLKSCRTAIKKLRKNKMTDEAFSEFKIVSAMLDKLAKRNILHKKKSASMKSTLAKHINKLASKPVAPSPIAKKATAKKATAKPKAQPKAKATKKEAKK
jgi:small subunit ribosomal protein S20